MTTLREDVARVIKKSFDQPGKFPGAKEWRKAQRKALAKADRIIELLDRHARS